MTQRCIKGAGCGPDLRIAFILIWTVLSTVALDSVYTVDHASCFGGYSTGPSNPYATMQPSDFLRSEADEVELEIVIDWAATYIEVGRSKAVCAVRGHRQIIQGEGRRAAQLKALPAGNRQDRPGITVSAGGQYFT
jgi:hypothetical protein